MTRAWVLIAALFISALVVQSSARQQPVGEQDANRAAAEQLVAQGEALRAKQDKKSLLEAVERFERSIPLWHAVGDRAEEAAALTKLGTIQRSLGANQLALKYLEQALVLRRAVGADGRIAETLSEIAAVHYTLRQTEQAIVAYTEALQLARQAGDRKGEANALIGIGNVHNSWGDYEPAVKAYTEALALARALGDRRTEALAIGSLGRRHQASGESQKALESFREALALFQALDAKPQQSTALQGIGAMYDSLGDAKTAIGFHEEALRIARSLGNRGLMANALNLLAIAHLSLGDHPPALKLLDEALILAREVGDPRLIAYTLHNQAHLHGAMGDRMRARDLQRQVLPLRRDVRDRVGEASVLNEIGSLSYELGERGAAQAAFNEALPITRELGYRPGEALARAGLARLDRDAGNLTMARTHLEAALGQIESMRSRIAIQELRTSYLAGAQPLYEDYIDLLMQLHRSSPTEGLDALALQVSERSRARSLVDLLTESRAEIRHGVDQALLERERSLQRRLNAKADLQVQLVSDPATKARAAVMVQEIEQLTTELRELEGQIRTSSPRYAALIQPQAMTAQELQRQVLDANTLLLEYALGDERSYMWAVTQSAVTGYELPKREAIEAAARRVYDLLTARQPRPGESAAAARARVRDAEASYPAAASALSDMVLGPVASHLGSRRLLIVSDGALQYIPFAALPVPARGADGADPSDAPLLVDHEVVSLPSASVLAVLRKELAGRVPAPKALAVLADPVFDAQDDRVRRDGTRLATRPPVEPRPTDRQRSAQDAGVIGTGATGGSMARLPFSRREAESILAIVSPDERMKALDFQASRDTVVSGALRDYRIVHFATHGFLDTEHAELSGVALSLVNERGEPQDGFLRLHELYNLTLPAELVVLSACQTALGKEARGEGLIGLTRGLMYAGAARVVASLWQVEDAATADLMKHFYARMLGDQRLSPAAALREAQLAMWREKRWSVPYYWAAFVIQGEWQGAQPAKSLVGGL